MTVSMILILAALISSVVLSNSLIEIRPINYIQATVKIFVTYL